MASPLINDETIEKLIRQGIPGFDADWIRRTKARLNAVKPMQSLNPAPITSEAELAKLKYSILFQYIKTETTKKMPPITMKVKSVTSLQMSEQWRKIGQKPMIVFLQKLVEEKMLVPVKGKGQNALEEFTITESGRRFAKHFERKQKMEKQVVATP